jgi:23S rRNA pseudouridine1911/1915/1917 synthase
MGQRIALTVPSSAEGTRVDAWLGRALPSLSRRHAKALAKRGDVRVNGAAAAASDLLHAGDTVVVIMPTPPATDAPHVSVLREDQDFLYLHKPAGLHTVRIRPDDPPTLADAAASLDPGCRNASDDPREAGALHRLDFSTSGVVAFARSAEAWARGREALPKSWKLYLARARDTALWPPAAGSGVRDHDEPPRWPEEASLPRPAGSGVETTWSLSGTGSRGHRVRVDPQGQSAASRMWRIGEGLFAVELQSGRRHQIRVHMAELGLPLEGDPLYGSAPQGAHFLLHAWTFQLGPLEPVVVAPPPPWATE